MHPLHKSPCNKTYSLDRISKQQWNNASSQGARMWRKWNNRDSNWLVACYGTLWCQLADRIPRRWLHICCTLVSANFLSKPRNKSVSVTMMQNETFWFRISRQQDYSGNSSVIFCACIVHDYNLSVPTNAHILIYCTLSGCHLFRPFAIRKLTTKWLKTHNNKLVLAMLCMWMYRLC